MTTILLDSRLPWLRKVASIHSEALDLHEPFVEVVRRFAHLPGTVALLSGGELDCARHHILGVYPWLSLSGHRTRTTLVDGEHCVAIDGDPFTTLRRVLQHCSIPKLEAPVPLCSGLFGYLAYDLKDCLEKLPRTSVDDLGLPLMQLVAPSIIVVHDRVSGATTLLAMRLQGDESAVCTDADSALYSNVARFKAALAAPAVRREASPSRHPPTGVHAGTAGIHATTGVHTAPTKAHTARPQTGSCTSVFTRTEYLSAVEAIRNYIVEGDVYQVNMSQRFAVPFAGDPYECFADMYAANPAPFFAYINAGDHQIVSTSPERFIELRNGSVETRPIKGTRPRGKTPHEDDALRTELQESAKEDAELSMIVDLLRNDIGKVCRAGSVRVVEHKRLEAYQNVYHLVSIVKGELDPGMDAVDLLRATFPGGSITGCPKIRAMEVIDELEPVRRHIYTGSIGYIGFDGSMDLSIAIRTATFTQGRAVFSVGGGIVYDSDPASEFAETLHKGRTLMNTLDALRAEELRAEELRAETSRAATVWQDGAFKPSAAATVPLDSEAVAYGFGFFETLRVQAGRPILLDAHVQRFELAWREFFRSSPPDVTWASVIAQLVSQNGLSNSSAVVKLVAAADIPSGKGPCPILFATAKPYSRRPALNSRPGLRLRVYPHARHTPLGSHKTLNYMYYKLAGDWAKRHSADEALILNVDGSVSETNTANLCCVFGATATFPTSEHALPGTMAAEVRRLLTHWGFAVTERRLTVDDLLSADHIFLTNSVMGAVPVVSLDEADLNYNSVLCDKINQVVFEDVAFDAQPIESGEVVRAVAVDQQRATG